VKKTLCIIGALLLALPIVAQIPAGPTTFGGRVDALSFSYGAAGQGAALVVGAGGGNAGTSYSITLNYGKSTSGGTGYAFYPFSYAVLPAIAIGSGATYEVVTPSSASCTTGQANSYQQCSVTASFTYAHGAGDIVRSGDAGLVEAVNFAAFTPSIGNIVEIGEKWYVAGGTQALIQALTTPYPYVTIEDTSGYYGLRWFTATPTVQTTTAAAAASTGTLTAGGSLTAGAYYFKTAYVDVLGQVSQASSEVASSLTATATNASITVNAPAAAAGQVGYIVYMTIQGGGSGNEFWVPVTSTNCTLTTIENVISACALANTSYGQTSSNALISVTPVNTTAKVIGATDTVNRTAFAYLTASQAGAVSPIPVTYMSQTATATSAATYHIAAISFPGSLFSQVGREYKICGSGHFVYATTGTQLQFALLEGPYNNSDVALATTAAATSTATSGNGIAQFCFNIDITVTGATTSTALIHAYNIVNVATAGTASVWTDINVAAVASLPNTGTQWLDLEVINAAAFGTGGFVLDTLSILPIH
jgi:hypothetical protein